HPTVKNVVDKFFQENEKEKILAVSVPQLYETGWEVYFDYVLLIIADDKIRLKRLIKRNNITEDAAQKRLAAQISQEEKIKKADFVIDNSGNIENTRLQLKQILEELLNKK
ncbi:MAG TPA: dephospho-CoA kinase, partial [Cyanobacteria bacterium UBA9971]|nr:dephospho-CoA kinase [Cyanobacteria bacterium UBA9971]